MSPEAALLWLAAAIVVQTLAHVGVGVLLWVAARVLRLIYQESREARAERVRRTQHDEMTIWEAAMIVHALETLDECGPCRDRIERIRARRKVWPPAPPGYERDGPTLRKL